MCVGCVEDMLTVMVAMGAGVGRAGDRRVVELCAVHAWHGLDLSDLQVKIWSAYTHFKLW